LVNLNDQWSSPAVSGQQVSIDRDDLYNSENIHNLLTRVNINVTERSTEWSRPMVSGQEVSHNFNTPCINGKISKK
jgi:hypothetical protein